jgi:hypothetical protein
MIYSWDLVTLRLTGLILHLLDSDKVGFWVYRRRFVRDYLEIKDDFFTHKMGSGNVSGEI